MTNQTPSHFTIDDLYELGWLEDPRLSPDSQTVAVVWVTVDRVNNGYRRQIVLVPTDGKPLRRFTRGKHDRQPRWSPDGKWLAFVSHRDDEHGQIYLIPVD
ncbi:MAG: S9 family peptidase, partial [Chloroflexus aggregans]